jgi:hypothetical protein
MMILKNGEKIAFFDQTTASVCENCTITLAFEKSAIFLEENWQKL